MNALPFCDVGVSSLDVSSPLVLSPSHTSNFKNLLQKIAILNWDTVECGWVGLSAPHHTQVHAGITMCRVSPWTDISPTFCYENSFSYELKAEGRRRVTH